MVAFTKFIRRVQPVYLAVALSLLAVIFVGSGCSTTKGRPMTAANMVPPVLLLSAGDVLDITFLGNTNFSGMRRIGPEGSLSMPTIGTVQAAGKTAAELEAELEAAYKVELTDPEIFVNMASSGNVVYVSGSVARPGRIVLERPLTALEAILEAGGFTPDANLKKVTVIRYEGQHNTTYELNLQPVYSGGPVSPFFLYPRDVVNVPKKVQWF
jgi:protein involved in polysaccharide export with SLBB domain